ncbi:DUF4406 domain-containing protein [Achromobacter spanius]|uniref:DUF4406 domain-containing protein n=1 Tax=Achromobacter spanius TaxID=217203 RepID=UPI00320AC10B
MTTDTNTPVPATQKAAQANPLSDEYVNAVIQRHGYDSSESVIAQLQQWIGLHGGEDSVTLLMYEAHKALSRLRAAVADEPASFAHAQISFPMSIPGNRVYLAGPMTGHEDFNFPAFHAAAERLRGLGLEVVNPADHGLVSGLGWADYMRWDLVKLAGCHSVYVLPRWEKSKGASLEVAIAQALGMPVFTVEGAPIAKTPVSGEAQPVADCWSDNDGDSWFDHPADAEFVDGLKVGDEYELQAGIRSWTERFRVTKAPDDTSDDYEIEPVSIRAAPQASAAVRILFPTHLRKMWSGGEVQSWLDEHQGVTAPTPSAKGSLERYRAWQAERAAAPCSCPSGDGSLRWPCAKHPQAPHHE